MLSGCQVKSTVSSGVRLSGPEVRQLFVGHTVESYNLSSGVTSLSYYYSDGRVEQMRHGAKRKGHWKVEPGGNICLSMDNKPFSCRLIYRDGDRYYKYRTTKQGKHKKIIRYQWFKPGRAFIAE